MEWGWNGGGGVGGEGERVEGTAWWGGVGEFGGSGGVFGLEVWGLWGEIWEGEVGGGCGVRGILREGIGILGAGGLLLIGLQV